ncbi:hypothetical protein LS70_005310 [Helicobacter sp. MIT 11-5569]|uniref:hypothetical protein n=1 Tax=Helicobacter sp. MIT 11-5569 TaxID=1548151 RepID=UPI00051F9443|nr:hypothetical protein [Helicobacter sp. MIT 11-5569]TLD83569.1 hypothetical protein LS70_005310 [Helicobacter sp. MIT 11-5569]
MALPFIAGLAVGAGATLLFTKREQIKKTLNNGNISKNIQKGLSEGLDKGREISIKALNYAKTSLENTGKAEKETSKRSVKKPRKQNNTKENV